MYKGQWKDDLYHGKGVERINKNTIVYDGDFVEGKKHGKGKLEFSDNYYEGDFENGMFHGQGKFYIDEKGQLYEG